MRGVLDNQEVWLAFADHGVLLGLLVLDGDWVGSCISTRPGRAAGSALVSSS